ncbi:MAG: hypothetical protein HY735_10000 [Verrucomicrobia bacterium]|nr:hypothetical protein [Verrucomicrobiota bacterium]
MIRTVVALDLVNYTRTANKMASVYDASGVALLNRHIQKLVKQGLNAVRLSWREVLPKTTGDGALLYFRTPELAHDFGVVFHEICVARNKNKSIPNREHRWFRVGIASGEVTQTGGDFAGLPIIHAVRREAAGKPGYLLIDMATFKRLPEHCQFRYGPKAKIRDKSGNVHDVRWCKVVNVPEGPGGVVSPDALKASKERLPNEVFAIELLTRPVTATRERRRSGVVTVTIDRRKVKKILISNPAKKEAVARYAPEEKRDELIKRSAELQSFLVGGRSGKNVETADGMCLRWASGGVLSIVQFAGDHLERKWVPLLFRDIRPYGWNIPLGASERWFDAKDRLIEGEGDHLANELCDPWYCLSREFLEEMLIVRGRPTSKAKATLTVRKFEFRPGVLPPQVKAHVDKFGAEHRSLREKEDKFKIAIGRTPPVDVELISMSKRRCTLKVRSDSNEVPEREDVLVCFSLLDLGIEVVKVVEYQLGRTDTMLDGEILISNEGNGFRELVRMPIALISLEYLEEIFGKGNSWEKYTLLSPPSVVARRPPTRDEILVYPWDVNFRMDIAMGRKQRPEDRRKRFVDWFEKFGHHFVDESGKGPIDDENKPDDYGKLPNGVIPSRLFTPATAKILNLYFNFR